MYNHNQYNTYYSDWINAMSFKSVQKSIEKKEGYSKKEAGAILASKTRDASPAAKKANPNLKKVK